jgi:hypothetical protein
MELTLRRMHGQGLLTRSERCSPKCLYFAKGGAGKLGHVATELSKAIVEPVFGQIKGVRNLRFLLRGLRKVRDEFRLIALTHNVLKLHRNRVNTRLAFDNNLLRAARSASIEASYAESCRLPPHNHVRHGELEGSGRAPLER